MEITNSTNIQKAYIRSDQTDGSKGNSAETGTEQSQENQAEQQNIDRQVRKLENIEQKVKAHETAHKAVGGALAGAVSYQYAVGPDGKRYIVGGEVSIQTPEGSTPKETVQNMERVVKAALAPADPSSQDRVVAARANAIKLRVQQEVMKNTVNESYGQDSSESQSAFTEYG